jgi:hypothetical protein
MIIGNKAMAVDAHSTTGPKAYSLAAYYLLQEENV